MEPTEVAALIAAVVAILGAGAAILWAAWPHVPRLVTALVALSDALLRAAEALRQWAKSKVVTAESAASAVRELRLLREKSEEKHAQCERELTRNKNELAEKTVLLARAERMLKAEHERATDLELELRGEKRARPRTYEVTHGREETGAHTTPKGPKK
jgi:hypothetical protein